MTERMRVLVVDDDPLARKRLRTLLATDAEVVLVEECADGAAGVDAVRELAPDLVFLDVQMPGIDGFGLVQALDGERMPLVIFVSAHVDFALRAFEAYALDYLLKPFDDERFRGALQRAKDQVAMKKPGLDPRLGALVEFLRQPSKPAYPEVLAIKSGGQYPLVRVDEIDWIEAEGNYAALHVQKTVRLLSKTLTELENHLLDPGKFVRVHRSTIVNLSRIATVEPLFHGELSLVLKDGTRLACSRRFRHRLETHIFFTS